MKNSIISIIYASLLFACTSEDGTIRALKAQGFSDIEVGGYGFLSCSEDDVFKTNFVARNPKGVKVQGTVCCGLFKNCTVRF